MMMPIAPMILTPAWRHGSLTPWGGDRLHSLFGKASPGPMAGESLELSAIPGLESRDAEGRTLPQLLERFGARLAGTRVGSPFPLLLKLIDARERLSVQVHPDDQYAGLHHGKLGKNEAWAILACDQGAQLVIGLLEGVTKEALHAASLAGKGVEKLLRTVEVAPGDVFYIPAGTVHAIGAGIVLYEIQQTSDVTYRLYDWGRTGPDGKGRELHLAQSLDVVDLGSAPQKAQPRVLGAGAQGIRERLLDTPFFVLDRLRDCKQLRLKPDPERFAALTALEALSLSWAEGGIHLAAGQTALLPADGFPLDVTGRSALLAKPGLS